ncbi:Alpha/Beta hydrolase protein [Apiospora sp. TS-2023a]
MKTSWFSTVVLSGMALALPAPVPSPEPVPSPDATLEARVVAKTTLAIPAGTVVGSVLAGVENFGGMPFAKPPVASLRLRPPQRLTESFGTIDATGAGPSCPQMFFTTGGNDIIPKVIGNLINTPFFQVVTQQTEDCLTMRVQRPAGTKAGDKLPVFFWIFGGGFELGSPQMYDATSLLANAVTQGKPFIFAAVNYRVAGFGFLPGKEILADGAANLGHLDQRMGLEWVADNIEAFGGDPEKMALYDGNNTYNGKPLFRGAIMNSGSILPTDPVNCDKCQVVYDTVVSTGGCSGAADTLECLRGLSYEKFLNAVNSVPGLLSYSSIALSYMPRPDFTALTASPEVLAQEKKYAAVPMIIGDMEDEGTIFALFQSNITTTGMLVDYLSDLFFTEASRDQVSQLVDTYPASITAGSPFGTGILNAIYPQYKRLAAILGDLAFTLTRRAFLDVAAQVNPDVPSWSFLGSWNFGTPILGTFHAADILQIFYGVLPNYASRSTQTYYFNFLYHLDPNGDGTASTGLPAWPQWKVGKKLMQFYNDRSQLLADDFRSASYNFITKNIGSLRV